MLGPTTFSLRMGPPPRHQSILDPGASGSCRTLLGLGGRVILVLVVRIAILVIKSFIISNAALTYLSAAAPGGGNHHCRAEIHLLDEPLVSLVLLLHERISILGASAIGHRRRRALCHKRPTAPSLPAPIALLHRPARLRRADQDIRLGVPPARLRRRTSRYLSRSAR